MYKLYLPKEFIIDDVNIVNHKVKFNSITDERSFVKPFKKLLYVIDSKFFTGISYITKNKDFLYKLALEKEYVKHLLDYLKFINKEKEDFNLNTNVNFSLYNRCIHLNLSISLENDFGNRKISVNEVNSYINYLNECESKGETVDIYDFLNYLTNNLNKKTSDTNNNHTFLYNEKLDLSLLEFDLVRLGFENKEDFLDNFDEEYIHDCFRESSDIASFIYKEDSETYTLFFGDNESNARNFTTKKFKNSLDNSEYSNLDHERFLNYKGASLVKHFLDIVETVGKPHYLKQYFDDINNKIIMVFYNKDKIEIFRSDELGFGLINYLVNDCII